MRTQDERAGKMHQVGAVRAQRHRDTPARQSEPETAVARGRHRSHPQHRVRRLAGDRTTTGGRRGCDHHGLVTPGEQVLGDPDHGMRDAVDVGRERLCDDRDPHLTTVRASFVRQANRR
jgi:hypothetical protein